MTDDIELKKRGGDYPTGLKLQPEEWTLSHWCASMHVGFCSVCSFPVPSFNVKGGKSTPHPAHDIASFTANVAHVHCLQHFFGAADVGLDLETWPSEKIGEPPPVWIRESSLIPRGEMLRQS